MIARRAVGLVILGLLLLVRLAAPSAVAAQATPRAGVDCGGTQPAVPASLIAATLTASPTQASTVLVLSSVTDISLPGSTSRFDYQSLDPTTGRLSIAHMGADQVVVFDTASQQVAGIVRDVKSPTGVLAVPELGRIFVAAAGSHSVAVIDAERLQVIAQVGQIGFPDGLDYAPTVKQVFVSDEAGGGEFVVDATTNEVVATIDVGGAAGNTHYDPGSGCILVVVQSQNQLAVVDPTTDRFIGRCELDAGCQSPHGFLIDASRRQAYVTCEDNALLLVVDLPTMAVTATYPVAEGPDVLAFDPEWRRLYVASESGVVSIFDETGQGLTPIGTYEAPHAHSVAVDPTTHLVYLPLEDVDGKPVLRILKPAPRA